MTDDANTTPVSPYDPLYLAEQRILGTFGDGVSITSKKKTLLKFGRFDDLGASYETVWSQGGNETYVTTNAIDTASSSSSDDTEVLYIEGHTVSGTGTDAQFTFVAQTATLAGTGKVVLDTPLARVSRVYNISSTTLVGDVYISEDDTHTTPGVPNTAAKIHMKLEAGENQSYKASTTFSNNDYFICTGGWGSVNKKTSATVDFEMQVRRPGQLFLPVARISAASAGLANVSISFDPPVIVPKNSDIRVQARASTTAVEVNAAFQGYLASIYKRA